MLDKLEKIKPLIGNTPLRNLNFENTQLNVFAKLEYYNYTGSIKDRAALNIIKNAILEGKINEDTTIVESSSGNFAIALAGICKNLKLKFIAVIDPNINPTYEKLLNYFCYQVIKVTEPDKTQGYLLTRINKVKQILSEEKNIFWPNQYENPDNYLAYYSTLGREIEQQLDNLDYAFIGVSSCGTIAGLSKKLKEIYPNIKIIAVDVDGSVIFNRPSKKRFISGIGASMVPSLLKEALIDEVLHIAQTDIVTGCINLVDEHMIFGGASSGASYAAVKSYFADRKITTKTNVIFLVPDKGDAYIDTIYNKEWTKKITEYALSEQ